MVLIRSDEGLTPETSALETPYDGQFTLSTQVIKPNELITAPIDTASLSSFESYCIYSIKRRGVY